MSSAREERQRRAEDRKKAREAKEAPAPHTHTEAVLAAIDEALREAS